LTFVKQLHTHVNDLDPIVFGGGAVESVTFDQVSFISGPERHEPGTPNVASIIGFGAAAKLLVDIGFDEVQQREQQVISDLIDQGLLELEGLKLVVDKDEYLKHHTSILTFVPVGFHSSDIAMLLSHTDVALRTGKLCAHPYVDKLSKVGVIRVSISPYNTTQDCETLVSSLKKVISFLA